jgi:hypothetical protein
MARANDLARIWETLQETRQMALLKSKWDGLSGAVASWIHGGDGIDDFSNGDERNPQRSAALSRPNDAMMPKLLAGLLLVTAVLMLTFVAAAGIVKAFAGKHPRLTHTMVEQIASNEYRKARIRCQRLDATAREACIAEAHAAEERARAVAMLGGKQQQDYVSTLRSQTDAMIDAGDRDAIVVEPACNIVARGQGSLCEIQVRPPALGGAGTNLIPATMTATQYAALHPLKPARPIYRNDGGERPAERANLILPSREVRDPMFQLAWSARQ